MSEYYEDLKADPKSFFSKINNALRKGSYRGIFKNGYIFTQIITGGPQYEIMGEQLESSSSAASSASQQQQEQQRQQQQHVYGDLVEGADGAWILCLADLYPETYINKISKAMMVRAAGSLNIEGLKKEFGSRLPGLFFTE
ncbi:uncharacterized protein BX664DRAFT_315330 [Halteromyces radiatus]|uniref:uncharacterized protein n=1 Tax=Halteromyces radiatus TaxID=101107 RepID=UPI0022205118|nr:uncharacterized protein BX664DRAFT_315330 [Halteromyces radiatus]KAI8086112.1 hypothetical protein BX664DRAFT_315330 [Halteromyces radiatus]